MDNSIENTECKHINPELLIFERGDRIIKYFISTSFPYNLFNNLKKNQITNYIIKLLNSKLYKFYIEIHKWSGFHHQSVLQKLPYIKLYENFTDDDVYKYFKVAKKQINFVKKKSEGFAIIDGLFFQINIKNKFLIVNCIN